MTRQKAIWLALLFAVAVFIAILCANKYDALFIIIVATFAVLILALTNNK